MKAFEFEQNWGLIVVLILWIVLCFLNSIGKIKNRTSYLKASRLLTYARLFSPKPMNHDYILMYRDKNASNEVNEFSYIPDSDFTIINILFDPAFRFSAEKFNATRRAFEQLDNEGFIEFLNGRYYKDISVFVMCCKELSMEDKRQFAIFNVVSINRKNRKVELLYASPFFNDAKT